MLVDKLIIYVLVRLPSHNSADSDYSPCLYSTDPRPVAEVLQPMKQFKHDGYPTSSYFWMPSDDWIIRQGPWFVVGCGGVSNWVQFTGFHSITTNSIIPPTTTVETDLKVVRC